MDSPQDTDTCSVAAALWELSRRGDLYFVSVSAPCFHYDSASVLASVASSAPRALDISGCTLAWAGQQALKTCRKLKSLIARDAYFADAQCNPEFAPTLTSMDAVRARLPLCWKWSTFGALEEFKGSVSSAALAAFSTYCPRLTRITFHATRVCELRMDSGSWRNVLSRLSHVGFDSCDLAPRQHLHLQSPHAVICDVMSTATLLLSLELSHSTRPALSPEFLMRALSVRPQQLQSLRVEPAELLGDVALRGIAATHGRALRSLLMLPDNPLVTDAGVESIASGCTRLERLALPFASQASDAGLGALLDSQCAAQLRALHISRWGLMLGGSLSALASRCGRLRELRVRGCHVACGSAAGVAALELLAARGVRVDYTPSAVNWSLGVTSCFTGAVRGSVCASSADAAAGSQGIRPRNACANGCLANLEPGDQEDHDLLCPAAIVPCPLAMYGCPVVLDRRDAVQTHLETCDFWLVQASVVGSVRLDRRMALFSQPNMQ
jgi:hypothetical protein